MASSDEKTLGPSSAITNIRETAKWIIAAFTAVGAALIAGSQFSNIGHLDFGACSVVTVIGFLIGLVGVAGAIWACVRVLSPDRIIASELVSEEKNDRDK